MKNKSNTITEKLIIRSVAAMAIWFVSLYLFALIGYYICSAIIWDYDSPAYLFLDFLRQHMDSLILILLIFGWFVIFCRAIRKASKYIDMISNATGRLEKPNEELIILPEELKGVQDELNRVRENAAHNASVAKEAEKRKNDLVMYLAHDLKTPLTSVIGYLTLLNDEPNLSIETRAKYTGIALDKAQRLEELINEFFDITRFNLTEISLEYSTVRIDIMLYQLISEFQPVLKAKDITCKAEIAENLSYKCDADKLSRVFDNLLRNAANYSYDGSEIHISAYLENDKLIVKFKNSGKTIPPEKLDKIFEQFFRLDTSRGTSDGGAGLGLAIAKRIVNLHGGEISVTSENEITEFTVKLPNVIKS